MARTILDNLYTIELQKAAGTYTGTSNDDSREMKIAKIAADLREKNPSLGERQAIDEAFRLHPELIH